MENNYLDNKMERFYPNGVRADRLIHLGKNVDHQSTVEFLFRRWHASNELVKEYEREKELKAAKALREKDEHERDVLRRYADTVPEVAEALRLELKEMEKEETKHMVLEDDDDTHCF